MNIKQTDYALLPNRAIPLDARSHFKDFEAANEAIRKVCTTEDAQHGQNYGIKYYLGQIITTTNGGTYQVCGKNLYYGSEPSKLQITYEIHVNNISITKFIGDDRFDGINAIAEYYEDSDDYKINFTFTCSGNNKPKLKDYSTYVWGPSKGTVSITIPFSEINFENDCYLKPFAGGSSNGNALVLNTSAPLTYDSVSHQLALNYAGALTVNNNQFTISTGNGLTTQNNSLTLSLASNSGLTLNSKGLAISTAAPLAVHNGQLTIQLGNGMSIKNNALAVTGIHHYTTSDDFSSISDDDYIYLAK